ncbi:hypothetical protein GCM10011391_25080 [Pullulanibacillus camelliae]|uniref:YtxH domain-containing protein n=1 Tax=Pullulanibacillus camelliae TaxID=1707096 RepID=A0A8J2YIQ2_9BACL|nr:YtxH domain-containing protein [Pullulanibacillus camelliae]GGE45234.1 hypothetical protein GCM10011391_25080 [Pullulanibacillus camelliae]
MEAYPRRSKLGKFMLVGGLVGAAVSLFDRGTRMSVVKGMGATKNGGIKLYQNMKSDPSSVSNYIREKADNIKMTAQEVSKDLTEMADKMNGVTTSSKQAYQYAMETGSEISEIAHKLRHPMQGQALPSVSVAGTGATTTAQSKPQEKQTTTASTDATTLNSSHFGNEFGSEGIHEYFPSNSSNK